MFLKSLTLKGFKSFADTTTLELEPGITVVVGPNGSGKSNVVDAVAWVLGAQGPRTVRSAKMEDVIFAGTPKRPALGRAEVILTIDNSAGLLPIEFSEVTISRVLWRSGESEYAINGVPCRLLDVQELLSDTGVGRQQHVIVSQGQLDAVLNAQPQDRRLVIEEAAGVLKFRRRREKAQRRLDATEGNLLRVQDLLREVRRQLRPLERQAEAARRHGDVVAELRAIRLFLAGRELTSLRTRSTTAARNHASLADEERALIGRLARLDADVIATEAALTAAGDQGIGDVLGRAEGLRERARGLRNLLVERARGVERLRSATIDQDLVASLEADAARLAVELAQVEQEASALVPQAADLASAEAELAAELEAFAADEARAMVGSGESPGSAWTVAGSAGGGAGSAGPGAGSAGPGAGSAGPDAAEVRGELAALRGAVERTRAEHGRLAAHVDALGTKEARLAEEVSRIDAERSAAEAEGAALAAARAEATDRHERVAAEVAQADAAAAEADGKVRALAARVEALSLALDEARARAGAQRLADVEGVVGTLLDVADVDPGWEPAFEAALGEAIAAVVVASPAVARQALDRLHRSGETGAVLALASGDRADAMGGADAGGGSAGAPTVSGAGVVGGAGSVGNAGSVGSVGDVGNAGDVAGAERVRAHVRPLDGSVGALLDRLLDRAVAVAGSWADALDVALAHPELIVVTRGGDRFAPSGWRSGAGTAGATRAALDEARDGCRRAEAVLDAARERQAALRAREVAAVEAEREAIRAADRDEQHRSHLADVRGRVEATQRDVVTERAALDGQLRDLAARLERDAERVRELEELLPALEAEEAAGQEREVARRAARGRLDERQSALRALRTDLEVRIGALDERRGLLSERRGEVESRLEGLRTARAAAAERREQLEAQSRAISGLGGVVDARLEVLDARLDVLRGLRRRQSDRVRALVEQLENLRRERSASERELAGVRERLQRVEVEEAELRLRLETATEGLRREFDCEPEVAAEAVCPELPAGTTPDQRARELDRELRLMGPINPLALEEYASLQERHTFLESQMEDVKAGRRELAKVIRAIDAEIIEVFSAAYADVADNFGKLFATLFPGGTGRLRLTDPDNLLETGIEVEARPSGKNVKRLSLLSGGERSLTAMAFLFAVFRSRPSPFYLMDEVEAALDDVNLHRFLDLIREFREEAQLVIVSHQKRTMEAADCLYGITMQPAGSSRVVSERVGAGA